MMRICLTLWMAFVSAGMVCAQPAGSIKDFAVPATNPMDPNGDGFVTSTPNTAFIGPLDETQFELRFLPLQQFEAEPGADNQYAAGCEFYELVNDVGSGADAAYYYYKDPDGIPDNGDELIFFRFRVARFSNGSTAFSILLDADYRFGFTGLEADPNAVEGNPGFEKEIAVYNSTGTSGGVRVFNVDGMDTATVVSYYASIHNNYQVSNALNQTSSCSAYQPVFVDMFLPYSALGISASTQIRMAAAVNEDINSSLGGGASDIGGIDGSSLIDDDDQFIRLINNYSPIHVIDPAHRAPLAQNASVVLYEDAANGKVVHVISATDANADTLIYSITAGNNLNVFSINDSTGVITVSNRVALDFETTPVITLLVRVSDGRLYDNAIITINLANVNESPMAMDALVSVPENLGSGSFVHFIQASDPDAYTLLQYSITAGNSAETFAVNSTSGEIIVNDPALLDFENAATFSLNVTVTDGILTDAAIITITVFDINESPSLTGVALSLDENALAGTMVHTVEATDPDAGALLSFSITEGNTGTAFSIDNISGEIRVNNSAAVDFETTPRFNLNVRVSDGSLFTDVVFPVNLNNINEAPVVESASITVERTLRNDDVVHKVIARDPEGQAVSYSVISGNADQLFALDASTGEIKIFDIEPFKLTPLAFDLVVKATDEVGLTGSGNIRIMVRRIPVREDIYPQKGFSPNGDGNNDFWLITGIEAFPENFIRVFNRWGIVVYEATGYDNDRNAWWAEGKDTRDVESTYFYIIQAGDFEPITGYVIVKP